MLPRSRERVRQGRGRPPIRGRGRGEAEECPPQEGLETGFELKPLLHEMSVCTPLGVDLVARDRVKNDQVIISSLEDESKEVSPTRRMGYISMCRIRKRKRKDSRKRANSKRVPRCIFGRSTWNTPFMSDRLRHRTQART